MLNIANKFQDLLDATRAVDFLGPLALRLYLVPVFWMAGTKKLEDIDSIAQWFGGPVEHGGLGLPAPELMAYLATYTEFFGAILLLIGFAVRWISIPLMITMIVAAVTVHWQYGWQAIADTGAPFATERVAESVERLQRAKGILQEHGNYAWLTDRGSFVVLNNGIEFAATYFIMLLALFFTGAGKIVSVDYWIHKFARTKQD